MDATDDCRRVPEAVQDGIAREGQLKAGYLRAGVEDSTHWCRPSVSISSVALVAFDVGLDELWRDQLDLVAKRLDLACPVVRAPARLHFYQAGREVCKRRCCLAAAKLFAKHGLTSPVDPVKLVG